MRTRLRVVEALRRRGQMDRDRFVYDLNREQATHYGAWQSAYWPPDPEFRVILLDLAAHVPALDGLPHNLATLRALVEREWDEAKVAGRASKIPLARADAIADVLRRIAHHLPDTVDRRALLVRAESLANGYSPNALAELATLDEELTFIVGRISTWYGKQVGGLPTAFACVRNQAGRAAAARARQQLPRLDGFLRALHAHLRLGEVPAFAAVDVFFMAGEGNRHPKHIAYFLPEDEGVKFSPFKKTYYFCNTHRALLRSVSLPLAQRLLELDGQSAGQLRIAEPIPTLGVLAHELGHFVQREQTSFKALNAANRWASIVLQETIADVFGTLFVAQVLAEEFGVSSHDVVSYYLAECLRYVDRGLGSFPDSDGMLLQLNYLLAFGALRLRDGAALQLVGEADVVIAGLRSLARVLADTLLVGDVPRSLDLHERYGPRSQHGLASLIGALRRDPPKTIEYLQETFKPAEG